MTKPYYIFSIFIVLLVQCKQHKDLKTVPALYVTTLDEKFLFEEVPLTKFSSQNEESVIIDIDKNKKFQEIDGFGYTLTGGSAMLMSKMDSQERAKLIKELFGVKKGEIGISYLRVSIGASDLDIEPWSYNDLESEETDVDLENFSLGYDKKYLIPILNEIQEIVPDIKILGSPWSPPSWMKDNNSPKGGSLLKKFYPSYANYFVKYIEQMRLNGINIDAITVQNEPLHPGNNPSLLMLAADQADFIKNHLGPTFKANDIETKIIIYDHNADRIDYPIEILKDSLAASFIDGSAFHLYGGKIEDLSLVHDSFPEKNLYFTEQWIGAPGNFSENLSWHTENLIIGATRNWCRTVLEWNLAADENQEPHTDDGGCVGCLGAITINGNAITRNPAYYIIAHASRFVRPGSIRVDSTIDNNINNVAFVTPDGKTVIILQNKNNETKNIDIITATNESIKLSLPSGAIGTLVF